MVGMPIDISIFVEPIEESERGKDGESEGA